MVEQLVRRYNAVMFELNSELIQLHKYLKENPGKRDENLISLQSRLVAFRSLPIMEWKLPRNIEPLVTVLLRKLVYSEIINAIIKMSIFELNPKVIREISITQKPSQRTQYIQIIPLFDYPIFVVVCCRRHLDVN